MLKQRIFTALILIPLFVTLVLSLSVKNFAVLTGIIIFWCAWEWSGLLGVKSLPKKIIYPVIVTALLGVLLYLFYMQIVSVPQVLYAAFIWWLIASILVVFYPKLSGAWGKGVVLRGLMGLMVLIPCWVALNYTRMISYNGAYFVLFLFVLIWGADSGAYFAGKIWGKHKLIPEVSPGKTWEGLFGALFISIIIVMIPMMLFNASMKIFMIGLLSIIAVVLFSVLGDLFESMLKRNAGIKDSGTLLPGHGGILDRIDSLTAAAPIYALSILWIVKNKYVVDWLNSINW